MTHPAAARPANPTWYRDALVYELHVRAFKDSDGDGIGDFGGLIEKLDYLAGLGVTAIWLLPFYPSPGRDDGYDISDYMAVNPAYGSVRDVRRLIREAHDRGLRVITELVANHTSDQHPWFQRARRAGPGTSIRNFYVWSDTPDRYKEARIIFKDFESSNWAYDPVARAYYWHRFYSHQPDLNYDNPAVLRAILRALDFWMEMGVDGMRLDAVPYLFEREGTNCENLPETHAVLRQIRAHIDSRYGDRMLLAEANQWPEDAVAYFGQGDECHMNFHFPLMPRLFMSIHMEDRFPVVDILAQTPPIPDGAQWALFLRNHDELTLEMVTDEERDFMYRAYTQDPVARINLGIRRRLAPLLGNNRRRIELMNGLLFSLPGTPVLYYGDEIGMGDNIYLGDRNGVRTPMQWSGDRNAGFSTANRQRLYLPVIVDPEYHYESINVETQAANPNSLLNWTKRLIALRKRHPAFGRGDLEMLHPENRKVLAFIRSHGEERILVVANLSRFVQYVELELGRFAGALPIEMFGGTEFPPVSAERPYLLTLGPHSFYWFILQPAPVTAGALPAEVGSPAADLPELTVDGSWRELFELDRQAQLVDLLPSFIRVQRWYGGKARSVRNVQLADVVPLGEAMLTLVRVDYRDGYAETYAVPLAFAAGARADDVIQARPASVLCRLEGLEEPGVLYDAMADPAFPSVLLEAIARRRRFRGRHSQITAVPAPGFSQLRGSAELEVSLSKAEQSNNSVLFGERLMMKLYRRLEEGQNPDVELGRYLSEVARFPNTPAVAGSIEYRDGAGFASLGMLQAYVPNQGDAWTHALARLDEYIAEGGAPPDEYAARFFNEAELLGRRTAEMHRALAASEDRDFAPAPSTMLDQRSLYQSVRGLALEVFGQLRRTLAATSSDARLLVALEPELLARLHAILERPITATRIRTHGDYHLGQVLWTGSDFVIIDFEGEPARPLPERRLKRWPLRDVAGMLRSLHYAAETGIRARDEGARPVAARWLATSQERFLAGYLATSAGASFVPADPATRQLLLDTYTAEKALYEVRYEMNNRPEWVAIPIRGLLDTLGVRDR